MGLGMLNDPELIFERVARNLKDVRGTYLKDSDIAEMQELIVSDLNRVIAYADKRLPDGPAYVIECLRKARDYAVESNFGHAENYWNRFLDQWRGAAKATADSTPE